MFGLFDKPAEKIRKHLPVQAHKEFDEFHALVDSISEIHYLQPEHRRHLSIGFILSVWACNAALAGRFSLAQYNYSYVQNMGINCHRMLGTGAGMAQLVLDALIAKGAIPNKGTDDTTTPKRLEEMKVAVSNYGNAIGDPRLGRAMADTLEEMTSSCPTCGGPTWNEAEKCGHCGAALKKIDPTPEPGKSPAACTSYGDAKTITGLDAARKSTIDSYNNALALLNKKHRDAPDNDTKRTTLQLLAMVDVTIEAMDATPISAALDVEDRKTLIQILLAEYKPIGALPSSQIPSVFAEYFLFKYANTSDGLDISLLKKSFQTGLMALPDSSRKDLIEWKHKYEWGKLV